MTRFSDFISRKTDDARITEIRETERQAFEAPFKAVQAKAAANAKSFSTAKVNGFALA